MNYQEKYERLCVEYNDMRTDMNGVKKLNEALLTESNRHIIALRLYANETQWGKGGDSAVWNRNFYNNSNDGHGYELAQQALQGCKL